MPTGNTCAGPDPSGRHFRFSRRRGGGLRGTAVLVVVAVPGAGTLLATPQAAAWGAALASRLCRRWRRVANGARGAMIGLVALARAGRRPVCGAGVGPGRDGDAAAGAAVGVVGRLLAQLWRGAVAAVVPAANRAGGRRWGPAWLPGRPGRGQPRPVAAVRGPVRRHRAVSRWSTCRSFRGGRCWWCRCRCWVRGCMRCTREPAAGPGVLRPGCSS